MGRKASLGTGCNHRRYPKTVVFTELGCHARCPGCGALGPGRANSKAAWQEFLASKHPYAASNG
jgi:hypothetical protein